jgi:hypothetical protein
MPECLCRRLAEAFDVPLGCDSVAGKRSRASREWVGGCFLLPLLCLTRNGEVLMSGLGTQKSMQMYGCMTPHSFATTRLCTCRFCSGDCAFIHEDYARVCRS